jgi:hypothetical protein
MEPGIEYVGGKHTQLWHCGMEGYNEGKGN